MKELAIPWLLFDLAFNETFKKNSVMYQSWVFDFDKHVYMLKPVIFFLRIVTVNPKNQLDTQWGDWCSF
jgi:formate-dependent nitrite reductase membrane component NrfD